MASADQGSDSSRLPPELSARVPVRETLPLDSIVLDAGTQVRAAINLAVVDDRPTSLTSSRVTIFPRSSCFAPKGVICSPTAFTAFTPTGRPAVPRLRPTFVRALSTTPCGSPWAPTAVTASVCSAATSGTRLSSPIVLGPPRVCAGSPTMSAVRISTLLTFVPHCLLVDSGRIVLSGWMVGLSPRPVRVRTRPALRLPRFRSVRLRCPRLNLTNRLSALLPRSRLAAWILLPRSRSVIPRPPTTTSLRRLFFRRFPTTSRRRRLRPLLVNPHHLWFVIDLIPSSPASPSASSTLPTVSTWSISPLSITSLCRVGLPTSRKVAPD